MDDTTREAYRDHLRRRLLDSGVPRSLHEGLVEYIVARRPMGGFLNAIVQNDLVEACRHADLENHARIYRVVYFLINFATAECWGSPAKVEAWLAATDEPRPVFE